MSKFKDMPDDYLRRNYVPDVYQPSIYKIDYQKLKDAGIKFISFDIDDTIAALEDPNPSKEAITLFEDLKNMGFELMLLTNARNSRAENFAERLGIKGRCISRAKKPLTTHFQTMKDQSGMEKSQMAHVGNSMRDDVAGGNAFGIVTCLVRRVGKLAKVGAFVPGTGPKTRDLKLELKNRGIWRKHHKNIKGDQYYQLGEQPQYQTVAKDIAEAAAANLIQQVEADKDTTYTLEEIMQNCYKAHEREGMETLRKHLGKISHLQGYGLMLRVSGNLKNMSCPMVNCLALCLQSAAT